MNQQTIKIHAYLAHCGVASRRASEQLVIEGRVLVNSVPAVVGQRIDPTSDVVEVDGEPLNQIAQPAYYLLNKPRGFVSTTKDELDRKTVLELLPASADRIYPVGRLDLDSEGLLLLTNDGALAFTLTHPKFRVHKTYNVLLKGIPSTPALNHLKRGIKLGDEYVKPISVTILERDQDKNTWIQIVIKEGKNQQVRRMMKRTGYEVIRLKRVKMGPLELGELALGKTRPLTADEVSELHALIARKQPKEQE